MFSVATPDAILPTAVDSFERTSSRDLQDFDSRFREIVHSSNRQSQFLTMYDVFKRQSNLLSQLSSVPDDWNGYGSPAPSAEAIGTARTILAILWTERLLPRRVLPSADGGVALVFSSANENRAVIETLNSSEAFILAYDRSGNSRTLDWPEATQARHESLLRLKDHLRGARLALA
jgi:hypothetical protein